MLRLEGSRLLVVDDEPRNTRLLVDIFRAKGCDVFALNDSMRVIDAVSVYEPDLIILDVLMPGKSGFELTKEIKSHEQWKSIPIILLTALADRDSCIVGLESGAEDYVSKPFSQRELTARVNNLLMLKKLHDFQCRNVQLLKEYDPASGLPKKEVFLEFTKTLFKDEVSLDICVGICEVDITSLLVGFSKDIRACSEKTICHTVIERMVTIFPPGILLGSLGVGKFGFVLEASGEEAEAQIMHLHRHLSMPVLVSDRETFLPFAISYVASSSQTHDWDELFTNAELALLEAKKAGGNAIKMFVPDMNSANYERWWISQELHQAIRCNQLDVYFQPQVDINSEHLIGLEALVRWHHPQRGFISPEKFIPLAEENGQIYDLGLWVLEQVCKQIKLWQAAGINVTTAINVSAAQLYRENLTSDFMELLSRYNVAPNQFELELTESSLMDPKSDGQLQALRKQGFQVAIDDFGTGYSNLDYLRKYALNHLKIDRTFIFQVCESANDTAIIQAILAIAKHMGFKVIAEGVETAAQLEKLRQLGCHEVQGFFYSRPLPADQLNQTLLRGHFRNPATQ